MAVHRNDIWTWLLISAITLLIWYGAAGATRTTDKIDVTIEFRMPNAADWTVDPPQQPSVELEIEGSASAVRAAREAIRTLTIEPPAETGVHIIDFRAALQDHPTIAELGVVIARTFPTEANLTVDELVHEEAQVLRTLPGTSEVEDLQVEPASVTISMPRQRRQNFEARLTVEPIIADAELAGLRPGEQRQFSDIKLRLTGTRGDLPQTTITPARVTVTLRMRSRTSELLLERAVRVQVLAPPEDEGAVSFEPIQFRDVTVRGPTDLVESIRRGDSRVMAVVILKSTEREAHLTQARVSGFLVVSPDGSSRSIEAWVGDRQDGRPQVTIIYPTDAAGTTPSS